ncbi:hypothetical protein FRB91_003912 [Serendipita sp. 411]|nr:hypothetical protein FRB91_003912 [Serendipita sp. 411]
MATPACLHAPRSLAHPHTRRSLSRTSASWTPPLLELVAPLADSLPTTTTSAGWACFPLFLPFRILLFPFLCFCFYLGLRISSPAPHPLLWYMGPRFGLLTYFNLGISII